MKASEAREIAENAASVDNTEVIFANIVDAAKKGLASIAVKAFAMTTETQSKLRKLGYHIHRGFDRRVNPNLIIETDIYFVRW